MVSVDTLVSANAQRRKGGLEAVTRGLHRTLQPPRRQLDDSISRATFRIVPASKHRGSMAQLQDVPPSSPMSLKVANGSARSSR
jgi:hypothetical protein